MYDLKSSKMPIAGYDLVLRAPLLHQHKAVIDAFSRISVASIMATLQPAIDAAKSPEDGSIVSALFKVLPSVAGALRVELLGNGIEAVVDAAAICLDTRANHRRLSAAPLDEDFDAARIEPFETGPDGSTYLECQSLRAFIRANITTDAAFWTLAEAVNLGGYGTMGKALVAAVAGGMKAANLTHPTSPTSPITA